MRPIVSRRIGAAIFERVAGRRARDGGSRSTRPGERWFAEDRPVRRVHGDSSMFIGGIRALLLQSLHPLAMAAVAQHSDYRGDPWGPPAADQLFPGRHHVRPGR